LFFFKKCKLRQTSLNNFELDILKKEKNFQYKQNLTHLNLFKIFKPLVQNNFIQHIVLTIQQIIFFQINNKLHKLIIITIHKILLLQKPFQILNFSLNNKTHNNKHQVIVLCKSQFNFIIFYF